MLDHNIEDEKYKVEVTVPVIGKSAGVLSFNDLKTGGYIKQRQKDKFTVRCMVPGGRLPIKKLKKIVEVAEKYGADYVHLSIRQSLEIPYVDYHNFDMVVAELSEVDQKVASCGPRVRVPTACSGCEYNPNGLSDTQGLTKVVNDRFFGAECNHKFKTSFSGCPIDCARTSEMDLAFQGAVFPEWEEEKCTGCRICASACQEDAIHDHPETGEPIFFPDKCLYCADCIRACPTEAWVSGKTGHIVRIGGKHGRHPFKGSVVAKFVSDEDVPAIIEKTVEWYNKHGQGKGRIRIGTLLREEGMMQSYMAYMKDVFKDKAVKDPKPPLEINIQE